MSRRKAELFNLSFLDLLTSALGAVIFLFIITPKGGAPAAKVQQAAVYFDTTRMQIFGSLDDSLRRKKAGDTLFALLVDYKAMPGAKPSPAPPQPTPQPARIAVAKEPARQPDRGSLPSPASKEPEKPRVEDPKANPTVENPKSPVEAPPVYKGDAPSVPCNVSFEISWRDLSDNVDLFVCKGSDCVYGGRKKDRAIGEWDSGKSRNRIFGNDLRTTQEAVRQFGAIIPGEYKLYAQFKESVKKHSSVKVSGLVYTKDSQRQERGESFSKDVILSDKRVLLGTVRLKADGTFQFIKN